MTYSFAIRPVDYRTFANEDEQIRKCKEWGLLTDKASRMKKFYYKGNGLNEECAVVGYADDVTAVIEFADGTLHCIHPAYLKEMQASQFGARPAAPSEEPAEAGESDGGKAKRKPEDRKDGGAEQAAAEQKDGEAVPDPADGEAAANQTDMENVPDSADGEEAPADEMNTAAEAGAASKPSGKKSGSPRLPEDKVRIRATVKEFATVPNHFADQDDEVIVYEGVVVEESGLELGTAWSSHSATLKKLELKIGDALAFDAKVIKKKLTRHPVPYKINNPSKIQKM